MGTWDDGLYDNDSALDLLGDLVALPGIDVPTRELAVGVGLVAWLEPIALECDQAGHLAAAIGRAAELPAAAQEALAALARDLEGALRQGSRSEAVRAALGDSCDGPRLDALVRMPGGQPTIDALGERAAAVLDRLAGTDLDLYEIAGDLAALGVVLELADAGLWRPAEARVAAWRVAFVRADVATREERGFWDRYTARVRLAFDLVARA